MFAPTRKAAVIPVNNSTENIRRATIVFISSPCVDYLKINIIKSRIPR
jgi:hypothetical protein